MFAPGRVNLIGGHSDYTGGLLMPMAIDLGTTIAGHRRKGDVVFLRSADEGTAAKVPTDVEDPASIEPAWARYVAAVIVETGQRVGFDGVVTTTLPIGAGLASSAALEVAVALALGAQRDRVELAKLLRAAELRASGVPCGVQDQLASLCGVPGHALLLDAATLEVTPVPVPDDVDIVVVDSGEGRRLGDVSYALRRDETVAAADRLGGYGAAQRASVAAAEAIDNPVLRRRARHLVTESERVRTFAAALAAGDGRTAGELMTASHASMRDDQQVSTPALDALVDRLVRTPGVHGARVTGGGFGGCAVALCDRGALADEGWHVRPSGGATVELDAKPVERRRRAGAPPEQVGAVDEDDGRHHRQLGDVALAEGVRLARRQHDVGIDGGEVVNHDVPLVVREGDAEVRQQVRSVGAAAEGHPRPPPDRHERRTARSRGRGRRPGRRRDAERLRQSCALLDRVAHRPDREREQLKPRSLEGASVLPPVLFLVDHDEIGPQRHDGVDVGILRPADVGDRRLLAEAGAGDRLDARRQQRLRRRRHEGHDPHHRRTSCRRPFLVQKSGSDPDFCTRYGVLHTVHIRPSSSVFLALNSASVITPCLRSSSRRAICSVMDSPVVVGMPACRPAYMRVLLASICR